MAVQHETRVRNGTFLNGAWRARERVTLLDAAGIKVHGVSYTKEQARQPGRMIPFQG